MINLSLHEKHALCEKNLGSAIVRGNKTDNRPSPNSQTDEFLLLSAECLKIALNAGYIFYYETAVSLKKTVKENIIHKLCL